MTEPQARFCPFGLVRLNLKYDFVRRLWTTEPQERFCPSTLYDWTSSTILSVGFERLNHKYDLVHTYNI